MDQYSSNILWTPPTTNDIFPDSTRSGISNEVVVVSYPRPTLGNFTSKEIWKIIPYPFFPIPPLYSIFLNNPKLILVVCFLKLGDTKSHGKLCSSTLEFWQSMSQIMEEIIGEPHNSTTVFSLSTLSRWLNSCCFCLYSYKSWIISFFSSGCINKALWYSF